MNIGAAAQRQAADWELPIGAQVIANAVRFSVWAPGHQDVDVVLFDECENQTGSHTMHADPNHPFGMGHFTTTVSGIGAGQRYKFRLDGLEATYPDPASRYQPNGPGRASEVVDPAFFGWADAQWRGIDLRDLILYEVHIGTATRKGTFDEFINCLGHVSHLGATALLLMPVADFAGRRNWGYDGVSLFAPANAYGGPEALRRLIDAAHQRKLAVIFDVVFSHMGADGNCLEAFSPLYLRAHNEEDRWGPRLDIRPLRQTRPIRKFLASNAAYWAREYHADGLRLDAIQAFPEGEEAAVVADIHQWVRSCLPADRNFLIIADDERRDIELIRPSNAPPADALSADDFHHQIVVSLTGLRNGYYTDYSGTASDLSATMRQGCWFNGKIKSEYMEAVGSVAYPGGDTEGVPANCFVWSLETHDQAGNRPLGERLCHLLEKYAENGAGDAAYRMASALLILSPATPQLFMGQEWAASSPFLYFSDVGKFFHETTRNGRQKEYRQRGFPEREFQQHDIFADSTFELSKLRWNEIVEPRHAQTYVLYRELLALRRDQQICNYSDQGNFHVEHITGSTLMLEWRRNGAAEMLAIANLKGNCSVQRKALPFHRQWKVLVNTEAAHFGGTPGSYVETPESIGFRGPGFILFGEPLSPPAPNALKDIWCRTLVPQREHEQPNQGFAFDVFLSYSDKDDKNADELRQRSVNRDRVFKADESFRAGDFWATALSERIERSHRFAVLITPQSFESKWVISELIAAIALKKTIIGITLGLTTEALQGSPFGQIHVVPYHKVLAALEPERW